MKIIVFAGLKGGCGKTSLAFNTAIFAAQGESVAAVDMDPQRSLEALFDIRKGDNPTLLRNVGSVRRVAADMARAGSSHAFMIVDSPGSFVRIVKDCIAPADCVVIPMRPSALDVLAQRDIITILQDAGKLAAALPVLNCIDGRSSIGDFVEHIGEMFGRPPVLIKNRLVYARSPIGGMAAFEADKTCTGEIATLWAAIVQTIEAA